MRNILIILACIIFTLSAGVSLYDRNKSYVTPVTKTNFQANIVKIR